jgi:hypothetical protein
MTKDPPLSNERSREARRLAGPLLAILAVAACGLSDPTSATTSSPAPSPTPAAGADGLVILAGIRHHGQLVLVQPGDRVVAVETPVKTDWISANAKSGLLATTEAGEMLSGAIQGERATWAAMPFDSTSLRHPPAFAAVSPDGAHVAAISAPIDNPGPFDVVLLDVATNRSARIHIDEPFDGPPQWLDDRRLAIRTNDSASGRHLHVIDATSGAVSPGPKPAGEFAVAPTAARVVGLRDSTGELYAVGLEEWLAKGDRGVASLHLQGSDPREATPVSFALDSSGEHLAVVWTDANDEYSLVGVYAADAGWRETARFPIPEGSSRAVVAWLR